MYEVEDYYKSGKLQMKGTYKDLEINYPIGLFTYYYENGNKKQINSFDSNSKLDGEYTTWHENGKKETSSNYVNSRPEGIKTIWHENGNKNEIAEYIYTDSDPDHYYKILQFWDENNKQTVINGNGFCDLKSKVATFYGTIKDGYKDGFWELKYFDRNQSATERYSDGKFISGIGTREGDIKYTYDVLEMQPSPKKGFNDFYKYIGNHFKFTETARKTTFRVK
ncbi:toxin-antitoxin system YwqK family antitoxin [Flavobacterium sp.]|uniref:toxin-antitoxin system YwqK family antitoxin n=1 Tax=Flavobacterium sp. TaxID=239 RepID=UPI003D6BA94B